MKITGPRPEGADPGRQLLTTSEVSELLGVSTNTVTRWARQGRLPCRLTLGGHHRFERSVIETLQHDLTREARPDDTHDRDDEPPEGAGKGRGKLAKALVGGF